ncbi:hypothetical protein Zmor_023337 [Zophobas morio]|uniref:SEFIR domain-containing protein n=1 Tax=Zophobas morio TaxID=2755281 RepID=A0AA38M7S6_9CUCU|nr:hypothetical protein Zmor_023337 [Zophobas morio]
MPSNLHYLWIFVIIWQPTLCFYNLCQSSQNKVLNHEECTDLYFEPSEKATSLGRVGLELEQNSLKITPEASSWTNTFLKISTRDNSTNQFCSTLVKEGSSNFYCFTFMPEVENETLLIEYKVENLPEISSRRFIFSFPNWKEMPLFLYIDQTDLSRLVLRAQKLPSFINISSYKVEAYKEKNGNTNLQDSKLFSSSDDIHYELFTYNDVGKYYFTVSVLGNNCTNSVCMKMSTPKVSIGRKGTRVVIGIVGASFILPFILFIFHILTKKYPEESASKSEERLVVAYRSSSKKHNEVVLTFAALLEQMGSNLVVDVIDLAKTTKKFPQKFCIDSLIIANRIIYVAPPKHDLNPILIDKSLSDKEFFAVIFDYCANRLPQFVDTSKTFKLFEDFENFMHALNISGSYDAAIYHDLVRKTEEAKIETDHSFKDTIPQIVITDSEPQEHDSLISENVIL